MPSKDSFLIRHSFITLHKFLNFLVLRKKYSQNFYIFFSDVNIFHTTECHIYIFQNFYSSSCWTCKFIKKESPTQAFSSEFYKIFKKIFFIEHLRWLLLKTIKPNILPMEMNLSMIVYTLTRKLIHRHWRR